MITIHGLKYEDDENDVLLEFQQSWARPISNALFEDNTEDRYGQIYRRLRPQLEIDKNNIAAIRNDLERKSLLKTPLSIHEEIILGMIYSSQGNFSGAKRHFEFAIKAGSAAASHELGRMYQNENSRLDEEHKHSSKVIKELYKHAADQGNMDASVSLASMHYWKNNNRKEKSAAAAHWEKAEAQGNIEASFCLAVHLIHTADEVGEVEEKEKNYVQALSLLRRTAKKGHVGALFFLGSMYLQGEQINHTRAHALFYQAAEKGNVNALAELGSMYLQGKEALINHTQAHGALISINKNKINYAQAAEFYRRAIEQSKKDMGEDVGSIAQKDLVDKLLDIYKYRRNKSYDLPITYHAALGLSKQNLSEGEELEAPKIRAALVAELNAAVTDPNKMNILCELVSKDSKERLYALVGEQGRAALDKVIAQITVNLSKVHNEIMRDLPPNVVSFIVVSYAENVHPDYIRALNVQKSQASQSGLFAQSDAVSASAAVTNTPPDEKTISSDKTPKAG